jgi:choline dehydrogenase-like flavoprotein
MGAATTFGRQGFDSLVQRTAPRALHGRSFARFETQFQIGWVVGATFSTAAAVPTQISLTVVAALLIPAAALYLRSASRALKFSEAGSIHKIITPDVDTAIATHLTAAEYWLAQDTERLAMIEIATAMDLAVASGLTHNQDLHQRCTELRAQALTAGPSETTITTSVRATLELVRTATSGSVSR